MSTAVRNRVGEIRKSRKVGAADLARRIGVSRQTIYSIEAGTYVPNTEVALNLARALEVTVDELFSLRTPIDHPPESMVADVLSPAALPVIGQQVRVCEVGSGWVSVPVTPSPYFMPDADGVILKPLAAAKGRAQVAVVAGRKDHAGTRLVLAGCDPATGLLAAMVEHASGLEVVCAGASSRLALDWLLAGKVHIAGSHLEDPLTGEFNLPYLRDHYPDEEFTVVTFARWEEGLVVAKSNPKGIRSIEDLARIDIRFANREIGSGSRVLLDRLLAQSGLGPQQIHGYERVVHGHLPAAYCVYSQNADACLATRSAARSFGLDFIALHSERYDLVMRKQTAELPSVKVFLDVLQRAALRRKLELLAGYDTSQTGSTIAIAV